MNTNLHQLVMSLRKKEFTEFLDNIKESIGTSQDDLNMLRYVIEDAYDEKFKTNIEYFCESPDLLVPANLELFEELDEILKTLITLEQYEKCTVVKECIDNFIRAFKYK